MKAEEFLKRQQIDYNYQELWMKAVKKSCGDRALFNKIMMKYKEDYLNGRYEKNKDKENIL